MDATGGIVVAVVEGAGRVVAGRVIGGADDVVGVSGRVVGGGGASVVDTGGTVVEGSVVVDGGGGTHACVVDVAGSVVLVEGETDVVEDSCGLDVDVVCDGSVVELLVAEGTLELVVV